MTLLTKETFPIRCLLMILAFAPPVLLVGCQTPTRPGEAQPLVEVQINNSPETGDDYVSPGGSIPARARVGNDLQINNPVNVTIKNANPSHGGQVRFGSGGANVTSLSLPANGNWRSFSITVASGQLSQRDKDAIIEVAENRPDGIVLTRKALQVTSNVPSAPSPGIAIEVNGSPTSIDDYVTWAPTTVELSLVGSSGSGSKTVRVQNMTPVKNGRLSFAKKGAISPPQETASQSSITVDLPLSGSSKTIYVAGDCNFSSSTSTCTGMSVYDKDAVMEVVDTSSGDVLGRRGMMVRIRKDANTLTTDERDRFLNALVALNNRSTFNNYQVYQDIHRLATQEAHGNPAFLPWHRIYILRLERELQAIDPGVALPYWQFDQSAPKVFDQDFMGNHHSPPSSGAIAPGNPLSNWEIRQQTVPSNTTLQTGITRSPVFSPTSAPSLRSESNTLSLGSSFSGFRIMEGNPHGWAHSRNGGWVSSLPTAVMDPLFFLLHANVDRLWAKWQFATGSSGRYDPSDVQSYEPQGKHPGSTATSRKGTYAEDEMWPWNGVTGTSSSSTRPQYAPGGEFPQTVGQLLAPPPKPSPEDVIGYESEAGPRSDGLGIGYDDVPFKP